MPEISTYRTPGVVHTDTSGFGGGPSAGGMDPFFLSLANRQIAYQDEMRQQQRQDRKRAREDEKNARRRQRNPIRDPLEGLRQRAEASKLHALVDPVPMKMIGGPGIIPGLTNDTNAYSAAQRALLLPQNAGMYGDRTPDEEKKAADEKAANDQASQKAAATIAQAAADEEAKKQEAARRRAVSDLDYANRYRQPAWTGGRP